jgi:hypothetical protein
VGDKKVLPVNFNRFMGIKTILFGVYKKARKLGQK